MKYRKKPVIIEAMQYAYPASDELRAWARSHIGKETSDGELEVMTLEDGSDGRVQHIATSGDYIIMGVAGEFYACKPDIFNKTYEPVQ